MSGKIANTMTTLAEENRDVKISLRLLIKYEIQSLLERLSALGDDSLLILANTSEGTCSHLGTSNADNFLQHLQTNANCNLKDTFQKFCSSCGGNSQYVSSQPGTSSFTGSASQSQNETKIPPLLQTVALSSASQSQNEAKIPSLLQTVALSNLQSQLNTFNSMLSNPQQQNQEFNPLRFTPYSTPGAFNNQPNSMNMRPVDYSAPLHPPVMERKKRNACRHFLNKGHCWQGSQCAFLHTRDQRILDTIGIKLTTTKPDQSNPSNQSPSSTEDTAQQPDSN